MQNLDKFRSDRTQAMIDLFGGEPLAGSGFETQEPEEHFAGPEPKGEQHSL